MVAIQQGLLFCGTRAPSELIPALLTELERLDDNAALVGAPRASDIRMSMPGDPSWFQTDEAELVLEDLICALSDCAGSNELYFGRRHLNSNEFGFWKCDD
jgi:hypothetical protein